MIGNKLPPIYKRNGKECYLDPIRKKLIYITPEETVRQKIISSLINELNVPEEMIVVEQHLSHYGINSQKRADIVIEKVNEDNMLCPIAVIECKAPEVYLDDKARNQMIEYCDLLGADYAMMTNGNDELCYKYSYEKSEYFSLTALPKYEDMLQDNYIEWNRGELPERIPFEELKDYLEAGYCDRDIGKSTPMEIAVPILNLWEGLLDVRTKIPVGNYGLFELIEDYGVRMLTYGNSGGGKFWGPYRSFLVKVDDSVEFYSIGVSTYITTANPQNVRTCISVAHDDEKMAHHALQLVVDDNLIVSGNKIDFYHHGRIGIGNIGSGKIEELRRFVREKYPKIIYKNKFYLGSLNNDRLFRLDNKDVISLIKNLISYAIVRDEYREFVKNNR